MKKLILVMVFVLLTALFIAFNYLLWERENRVKEMKNLEYANASNNASISAQKREIDSLEEENQGLEDKVEELGAERDKALTDKQTLSEELVKTNQSLQDRIRFINVLKQNIDIKVLSEPLVKWAEAVNQGKFEEAYQLEYEGVAAAKRPESLETYTENMKNSVKRIEINEVKLDKLRGSAEGEIYLEVRMDVKLADGADKAANVYTAGVNEKYVKLDYSYEKNAFIISAISNN